MMKGVLLIKPIIYALVTRWVHIFHEEIISSAKWRPFCLGLNVLRVNSVFEYPVITELMDAAI